MLENTDNDAAVERRLYERLIEECNARPIKHK